MDEQRILPADVRASLPPVVRAYVAFLEGEMTVLRGQVVTLHAAVAKVQGQLADAQARAQQHSGNSSRPPSTDSPAAPPRPKQPVSGRKRGGQKGHPGHTRLQLSGDTIAEIVTHRPLQCPSCTLPLDPALPTEGDPICQQVWEIPTVVARVTEHRGYGVRCPHCAVLVPAPDLPDGAFGPRVTALGSVLHGRYRLSMRETAGVLADLFGVPIGVGSVPTLCQETSSALDDACRAVAEQVKTAAHVNVDETGWKQAGARRWLWTAVAAHCTRFLVATRRNAAVLPTLLGDSFAGLVSSDRYGVYRQIPIERRQVCLAHLHRNITAFAERTGPVGDWGKDVSTTFDNVFAAWHEFTDHGRDRAQLIATIAPLQTKIQTLLDHGKRHFSWQAQSFCSDVSTLEPALWTFVTTDGVEPTNNAAERALRPAVLWRKGCFGADSDEGNVFVARILTVIETCRQQKKHLLSYLTEAIAAFRQGLSLPPLLASPSTIT
jgi:transposase